MQKYTVKIGEESLDISIEDLVDLDLVEESAGTFHLLNKGKSYNIRLLKEDLSAHKIWLEVNGTPYELCIENELDRLVQDLGFANNADASLSSVKAPMPGLILDILVEEGQEVEKGSSLLILEAMKMENVIKAPGDAKVKRVEVNKGEAVDKGQLLIEWD